MEGKGKNVTRAGVKVCKDVAGVHKCHQRKVEKGKLESQQGPKGGQVPNEFPNFAALTEAERQSFFEALTTARRNVEKSGTQTRVRFGTVHDEYLRYFEGNGNCRAEDDHERPSSSSSLTTHMTYTLTGTPVEAEDNCSSKLSTASLLEAVASDDFLLLDAPSEFSLIEKLSHQSLAAKKANQGGIDLSSTASNGKVGSGPAESESRHTLSECESLLVKDKDKIVDLYLKRKQSEREKEAEGQDVESESRGRDECANDDFQWEGNTTRCMPIVQEISSKRPAKKVGKENRKPEGTTSNERLPEIETGALPAGVTPKFDALNSEEKEIFFKILKEARDNVLQRNPQKKDDVASVDNILKRYRNQGDTLVSSSDSHEECPKQQLQNVKVKVTLTSGDNTRLQVPVRDGEDQISNAISLGCAEDEDPNVENRRELCEKEVSEKRNKVLLSRKKGTNCKNKTKESETRTDSGSNGRKEGGKNCLKTGKEKVKIRKKDGGKYRKMVPESGTSEIVLENGKEGKKGKKDKKQMGGSRTKNNSNSKCQVVTTKKSVGSAESGGLVSITSRPAGEKPDEEEATAPAPAPAAAAAPVAAGDDCWLNEGCSGSRVRDSFKLCQIAVNGLMKEAKYQANVIVDPREGQLVMYEVERYSREEEEVDHALDLRPAFKPKKVRLVNDGVVDKIRDLIRDLRCKAQQDHIMGTEYGDLLLDYADYLQRVLHILIGGDDVEDQMEPAAQVRSLLTTPQVYLKFNDQSRSWPGKMGENIQRSVSNPNFPVESSGKTENGGGPHHGNNDETASMDTHSLSSGSFDSRSTDSATSVDERFSVPMFLKKKRLPTTKIRLLQDLLKERAKFVEGSINEFKIVDVPPTSDQTEDTPTARLLVEDAEDVQSEMGVTMRFFKALMRLCKCGKKNRIEEDNMLENLKGEAVAVDVSKGTKDPASVTLNESTMEVLKAAERKKIIQKYWRTT